MNRLFTMILLLVAIVMGTSTTAVASTPVIFSSLAAGNLPPAHVQFCMQTASQVWGISIDTAHKYYLNGSLTIEIQIVSGIKYYMIEYDGVCVLALLEI
jgi:hypothetical protein